MTMSDLPRHVLADVLLRAAPFNLDYDVALVCKEWAELSYANEAVRPRWHVADEEPVPPPHVHTPAPHIREKSYFKA